MEKRGETRRKHRIGMKTGKERKTSKKKKKDRKEMPKAREAHMRRKESPEPKNRAEAKNQRKTELRLQWVQRTKRLLSPIVLHFRKASA